MFTLIGKTAEWIETEDYGRVLRVYGDYVGTGEEVTVTLRGSDGVITTGTVVRKHNGGNWCYVSETRSPLASEKKVKQTAAKPRTARRRPRRVTVRQPRRCPECGSYGCPPFECMA